MARAPRTPYSHEFFGCGCDYCERYLTPKHLHHFICFINLTNKRSSNETERKTMFRFVDVLSIGMHFSIICGLTALAQREEVTIFEIASFFDLTVFTHLPVKTKNFSCFRTYCVICPWCLSRVWRSRFGYGFVPLY